MKTRGNIRLIVALAGPALLTACSSSREFSSTEPTPRWTPQPKTVAAAPAATTSTETTPIQAPRTKRPSTPQTQISLLSVELPPNPPTAPETTSSSIKRSAIRLSKPRSVLALPLEGTDNTVDDSPIVTGVSRMTFAEEGADFDPSVSKDGRTLVYASTQHRKTSDIYLKKTESRVVTQLTNDPAQDAMPVISPDGTKIAFASDRAGNWDVYVMPINGGRAVQVTSDLADDVHPSWSPDGKQLVFSRQGNASGRWEMWVTEIANPAVANFIGYGLLPQWCPVAGTGVAGSDRILFQLGRERGRRSFSLWTVDITGGTIGNTTEIASSGNTALIDPSWSPDGRWVVYTEVPVSADGKEPDRPEWATLWMISSEGEAKVRLTGGAGLTLSPVWASTNKLFFVSDRSGVDNIWSLDLNPAVRSAQATLGGSELLDGPMANSTSAVVPAVPVPQPASHEVTEIPVVSVPETHGNEGTDH